ncbi:DUF4040 domain-containing protein [Leptolyngbya sp. PCC 6406]|uniref:DUF4040 domain-containing protein n=1 Tax=Leptolyngbya sp. PCC 6406 TaxID=1173264 RepID=UPI0002ABAD16|nr:DUF4040 domain-containing protein [Leptolyngbya sp. PCC 6406]
MTDIALTAIVVLLPVAAFLLVFEVNPYHALVIRGILGAVAALVYTVLGAADVALTEALVGTMLAVTLYAVAVRSSMVLRLGIWVEAAETEGETGLGLQLVTDLRALCSQYHLRLEQVPYPTQQALQQALMEKEIHAICLLEGVLSEAEMEPASNPSLVSIHPQQIGTYHIITRLQRLYDIMHGGLATPEIRLTYTPAPDTPEAIPALIGVATPEEKPL